MSVLLPAMAGASSIVAGGAVLYRIFRPKFPIKVHCWFCHECTVVPYGNQNCWDCPQCDQYNGFAQDGDYNKAIPAQYSENLNHPVSQLNLPPEPSEESDAASQRAGLLCDACNRNQLLKVKQLAHFVPYNEITYDMEVDSYRQHLEQVYRVCAACKLKVQMELERQHRELNLEELMQQTLGTTSAAELSADEEEEEYMENNNCQQSHMLCRLSTPLHIRLLRLSSTFFAVLLFLASGFLLLGNSDLRLDPDLYVPRPIASLLETVHAQSATYVLLGLFMAIVAIFLFGAQSVHTCDALTCFSWLLLLLLLAPREPITSLTPLTVDSLLLQTLASAVTCLVSAFCAVCPRYEKTPKTRLVGRKKRRWLNDSSLLSSTNSSLNNSPAPSVSGRDDNNGRNHTADISQSPNSESDRLQNENSRAEQTSRSRTGSPSRSRSENGQSSHSIFFSVQNSRKRTSEDLDSGERAGASATGERNGESLDLEHAERLQTMSLGTPKRQKPGKGIFSYQPRSSPSPIQEPPSPPLTPHTPQASRAGTDLSSLRQRPLISPARFADRVQSRKNTQNGPLSNRQEQAQRHKFGGPLFGQSTSSTSPPQTFSSFRPIQPDSSNQNSNANFPPFPSTSNIEDDRASLFSVPRDKNEDNFSSSESDNSHSSDDDESLGISRLRRGNSGTSVQNSRDNVRSSRAQMENSEMRVRGLLDKTQIKVEPRNEQEEVTRKENSSHRSKRKSKQEETKNSSFLTVVLWLSVAVNISLAVYFLSGTEALKETLNNLKNFTQEMV